MSASAARGLAASVSGRVEPGVEPGVEDRRDELALARLERHDLLLDGVRRDEPVDHHLLRLADAMRPVDGLRLARRVPPRVEQEHVVGLGQVQPESARLQADQEHGCLARAEPRDLRVAAAGRRRPVEVRVGHAGGIQPGPRPPEERRELAEHERTMPLGEHVVELLEQRVELRRRDSRRSVRRR